MNMQRIAFATLMAAIAAFGYQAYKTGYRQGDRNARSDYATLVNRCYDAGMQLIGYPDDFKAGDLYSCIAADNTSVIGRR